MTRPIFEPTLQRTDARLGYGQSQLFRRPAPTLGTTIPCFRAYGYDVVQTITNNNTGYVRFDRWQSSDTAVINSGGWLPGTPDYIDEIDILERGLYAFMFATNFSGGGLNAGDEIGFALEDASTTYAEPPQLLQPASFKAGDGSTGMWSWTHIQSFPPIWVSDAGGANVTPAQGPSLPKVKLSMFNLTGATITLDTQMIEVHQLLAFDYETIDSWQSQA